MRRRLSGLFEVGREEWWWLGYLVVFALAFILFMILQASPIFADPDSFYHAKMAILIRDQGVVHDFPWLRLTVLGQHYTDQHFLYHVALIPFVTWLPPLIGIKLATVFFGAILVTVMFWMMRQYGVRGAFFFVIIFLFIRPATFRLSLAKAPSTSLIFLIVGLTWMFSYHLRRLFMLAFTYVWYYGGFPLLGVAAVIYTTVSVLHNRLISKIQPHRWIQKILALVSRRSRHERQRRLNLRLLLVVTSGLAAGVIINPYFPGNLMFYLHQLINIGIINFRNIIGVGGEWYPYSFGDLIANGAFATLLILLALVGFLFRFRAQSKQTWTLGILTIFFFFLTMKSRRYVEYYIPIAVLFSAFSISDSLRGVGRKNIIDEFRRLWLHRAWSRWTAGVVAAFVLFAVGFIGGRDFLNEYHDLRQGFSPHQYERASQWLAQNTPVGARVVHSDWDEFPLLFYHNTHNTYIIGLDPTFLYKANQDTYWTWANLTLGKYQGNVYQAVTRTLGSRYVFIASGHGVMQQLIERDGHFRVRYRDDEATIYEAT